MNYNQLMQSLDNLKYTPDLNGGVITLFILLLLSLTVGVIHLLREFDIIKSKKVQVDNEEYHMNWKDHKDALFFLSGVILTGALFAIFSAVHIYTSNHMSLTEKQNIDEPQITAWEQKEMHKYLSSLPTKTIAISKLNIKDDSIFGKTATFQDPETNKTVVVAYEPKMLFTLTKDQQKKATLEYVELPQTVTAHYQKGDLVATSVVMK